MHAQDRHSAVQDVHSELCGIVGDCSASSGIYLGKLGILEIDLILVELSTHLCNELGVGIRGSALSAGTGVLVEYHAAAEER